MPLHGAAFASRGRRRAGAAVRLLRPPSHAPARGSPLPPPVSGAGRRAGPGGGAGAGRAPGIGRPGPAPSPSPPRRRGAALAAHTHTGRLARPAVRWAPGKAGRPAAPWAPACATRASWSTQVRRRGRAAAAPRGPAQPSRLTLSSFLSPLPAPAAGIPARPARPAEEKQVGGCAAAQGSPPASLRQWGGVLLPGHGGVSARGSACRTARSWIYPRGGRFACFISLGVGLRGFVWRFGSFFFSAFGRVESVWMEKCSAGASKGISVFGARLPIARPALRSTDAQAQSRSCCSSLLGVADHHLAASQDLGVREHLFWFAKQIAVWRRAFESWRVRGWCNQMTSTGFFVRCLVFVGISSVLTGSRILLCWAWMSR